MNLILETERILLRPFELSDAEDLFIMDNNPNVHKYLWQKPTQNIEESIEIIKYIQKQYTENKIGRYVTIEKETGKFIGWTGIKYINDHVENGNTNFYDYGYRLDERFWNKGYATEATFFWLDYGFNQMNIQGRFFLFYFFWGDFCRFVVCHCGSEYANVHLLKRLCPYLHEFGRGSKANRVYS